MNNLLKAAARKHALANGIATSQWSNDDVAAYVIANNIKETDNLKPTVDLVAPATKVTTAAGAVADADTHAQRRQDAVAKKESGSVEQAIADLVGSLGIKAESELDEARVLELIAKHSKAPILTSVEIKQVDKPTVTREGVHKDYATVLAHIAAKVDIAAVGPAGSGKSTMFNQIAKDLELDYYIVSSPQTRSEILGYMDAKGEYVRTPMRDAYENGGLIVIEEYDGANTKALLSCNNLVANDETDFPDGMVKKHENFVCVMAGNTFGTGASRQYVGRTQIDAATLDRFAFLEIGYDEAMEVQAAKAFNPDCAGWVTEVQAFRKRIEKAGIRHVVSPRASIMGAKLLLQGLPLETLRKTVLHKGLSQDQIAQLSR